MNILYLGVSSKYIHTMPAGWFLAEYLNNKGFDVKELYHNVNENYESVLKSVLSNDFDTLLVSVYIFNINFVKKLCKDIKALRSCVIIAGGPEADECFPSDHIVVGEGENALLKLLKEGGNRIIFEDKIQNLDIIPSPYTDSRIASASNKLLYYESSRGCPFCCAYCMAGLSGNVRYFGLNRVKSDLLKIANNGAKIVKFTDRTFNMDASRTREILSFIKEKFAGFDICFHFEVGGDLFDEEAIKLLNDMPRGLIQLEAGVQTLNPKSLDAVMRPFDAKKFFDNMQRIIAKGNIHTHLDLIAGLPFDSLCTFKESFDKVFLLKPHMLQLGFLKFLKYTPIRETYNAKYSDTAPYEVISTPFMSEADFAELKKVESVVDRLYNSGKFCCFLESLMQNSNSSYKIFLDIAEYFSKEKIKINASENVIYQGLYSYIEEDKYKSILKFDYLITNNSRIIPPALISPYSDSFKKFLKTIKPDRYSRYAELHYLPIEGIEGNFIVKFDYSNLDTVKRCYNYEIIKK